MGKNYEKIISTWEWGQSTCFQVPGRNSQQLDNINTQKKTLHSAVEIKESIIAWEQH